MHVDNEVSPEALFRIRRQHFIARVEQRVGPHVDAMKLHREIYSAILSGNEEYARYRCIGTQPGSKVYRICIDGREWFIAADETGNPVTVLPRRALVYRGVRIRKKPRRQKRKPVGRREARRGRG